MYLFHSVSPAEINTFRIYKEPSIILLKVLNNPLGGNMGRKTQEQCVTLEYKISLDKSLENILYKTICAVPTDRTT